MNNGTQVCLTTNFINRLTISKANKDTLIRLIKAHIEVAEAQAQVIKGAEAHIERLNKQLIQLAQRRIENESLQQTKQ